MTQTAWVLGWAAIIGCGDGSGRPGPNGSSDTDGPTVPTQPTDTGAPDPPDTDAPPVETTLAATCALTANALRASCTVIVDPPQAVQVRFARTDGTGLERVHTSDAVAAVHEVPVYFMTPLTSYDLVVSTVAEPAAPVVNAVVTTLEPPQGIRVSLVVTGGSSVPYVGSQNPCGDAIATIFDTATGALVWYQVLVPNAPMGIFGMVQFTDRHTVLALTDNEQVVVEYDLAGNEVLRFTDGAEYTEELHHDLFERNGLYYLLFQAGNNPILDGFLVLDAAGTELAEWRAATSLTIPGNAGGDWMHTNTIWVDATGDVFLSSYEQNTILKIEGDLASPDFGQLIWAMDGGGDGGFGQDYTIDWGGLAPGWANQHNVHVRADGRLMFLDNSHERALIVSFDEVLGTATVDQAFDIGNSSCIPQGTAMETTLGHAFVACSGENLAEFDAVGAPVWQAAAECPFGDGDVMRWSPLEGW